MHNHVINCAEALSFQCVKEEVREELLNYFKDGHSPSSALYAYQDELHLKATDEQELIELLADRSVNPDYPSFFKNIVKVHLAAVVNMMHMPGKPSFSVLLQISCAECTKRSYKLVNCATWTLQHRLNLSILHSSITLIYTSCAVGTLPFGLFITSDELEITLEKSINLLKTILPSYAFFGRGPQVGPIVFIADDSNAERNALELCWPKGIHLLCTFYVMQAFWKWVHDPKHHIKKEDRAPIMEKMKRILYVSSCSEMDTCYYEFKQMFYCLYPLLQKHFELLWNHRQFWALSFVLDYLCVEIIPIITLNEVLVC
ncbi:unnamed protein product [Rhizophagus irregularis]|nr:unnamed protein product [Rhizophagus irregularis]